MCLILNLIMTNQYQYYYIFFPMISICPLYRFSPSFTDIFLICVPSQTVLQGLLGKRAVPHILPPPQQLPLPKNNLLILSDDSFVIYYHIIK